MRRPYPVAERIASKDNSQTNTRGGNLLAWVALHRVESWMAASPAWSAFIKGYFEAFIDG
jgi:hypothetical protein